MDFRPTFGQPSLLGGEIQIPGKPSRDNCPSSPTPEESSDEEGNRSRIFPRRRNSSRGEGEGRPDMLLVVVVDTRGATDPY